MTPEQIKRNIEELRLLDSKKNEGNGALGWVFFKNRLTELALPTIEALLLKLSEAQAERDALQARIDGALAVLQEAKRTRLGDSYRGIVDKKIKAIDDVIEILTGEGES